MVSCCCFGAYHTQRSDLNSSRDAADTISTRSLFQSHKKELEYVASEILSWKNLVGPLVRLWLPCTCQWVHLRGCAEFCTAYQVVNACIWRQEVPSSGRQSSWWHILEFWNGSHYRHSEPLVSAPAPMLWCEFVGLGPRQFWSTA